MYCARYINSHQEVVQVRGLQTVGMLVEAGVSSVKAQAHWTPFSSDVSADSLCSILIYLASMSCVLCSIFACSPVLSRAEERGDGNGGGATRRRTGRENDIPDGTGGQPWRRRVTSVT